MSEEIKPCSKCGCYSCWCGNKEWTRKFAALESKLAAKEKALAVAVEALEEAEESIDYGSEASARAQINRALARIRALSSGDPDERIVQLHKSCGCVTCVCESEIQCGGCGAKMCAEHTRSLSSSDPAKEEIAKKLEKNRHRGFKHGGKRV